MNDKTYLGNSNMPILYQLYLLNSPKLFNKFTMVNADAA
jgi:hypothetical protein